MATNETATIWKRNVDLKRLNKLGHNTMVETLGIRVTEVGPDWLRGEMPVDTRTQQPAGLLHGGASIALAESLGSLAANLAVDEDHYGVGIEVNGNHMRGVRDGVVVGTASALHIGQSTQVWRIDIVDGEEALVCCCRLTVAVIRSNQLPKPQLIAAAADHQ